MNTQDLPRLRLVDAADDPGRTTPALVNSLAARLLTLRFISGADAVGSFAAGLAILGREVMRSADGARLARALEAGRAGANGDFLWSKLLIGAWVSSTAPTPVLDQLHNDLALLLSDELEATFELPPLPPAIGGGQSGQRHDDAPATFVEFVVGLWAFSQETMRAIAALAAPTLGPNEATVEGGPRPSQPDGSLLR